MAIFKSFFKFSIYFKAFQIFYQICDANGIFFYFIFCKPHFFFMNVYFSMWRRRSTLANLTTTGTNAKMKFIYQTESLLKHLHLLKKLICLLILMLFIFFFVAQVLDILRYFSLFLSMEHFILRNVYDKIK